MHRLTIVFAIASEFMGLSFMSGALAQSAEPLYLERKTSLGNVNGRIDHMAIDLKRRRLFVAELGNDTLSILDLDMPKVVHRISGLKEPQGVGYIQSNDTLYVTNGGDGSVRMFRGAEYSPAGRIDLGADADNIRVDLSGNRLFVGHGSGGLNTIDVQSNNKHEFVVLPAHPESFQLDSGTRQIFVNLPNSRAIAVVDATTGQLRSKWALSHEGNFPMALDPERQRVLVVFRSPPKFAAYNWQTGALVAEVDTCGDADDLFLDVKRQRIYIICGTGFVDVLKADDAKYSRIAKITTVAGARTGLFVGDMDRLFVAARAQSGQAAWVWVYRANP